MLASPAWPNGFCPQHAFEPNARCNVHCMPARQAIAALQADYDQFWRDIAVHRRWHQIVRGDA